jgi:acyl carrier protein
MSLQPQAPQPERPRDLLGEVRALLAALLGRAVEEIHPEADLERDLGMDSLRMIEAVVVVEQRFDIALPPASSPVELSVATVGDLARLVAAHLSQGPR